MQTIHLLLFCALLASGLFFLLVKNHLIYFIQALFYLSLSLLFLQFSLRSTSSIFVVFLVFLGVLHALLLSAVAVSSYKQSGKMRLEDHQELGG